MFPKLPHTFPKLLRPIYKRINTKRIIIIEHNVYDWKEQVLCAILEEKSKNIIFFNTRKIKIFSEIAPPSPI